MQTKNELGKEGEAEASAFLLKKNYTILETNWYWKHYELDIIATHNNELVIVEVKTRSFNYLISPEDAIDRGKIKRIVAAADVYVRFNNINMPVRFDIITLVKKNEQYEIEHLEDAFYAPIKR